MSGAADIRAWVEKADEDWLCAQLLDLCLPFEAALEELREDCERLSQYAVDVRYPDIGTKIEEAIGREAVAAAERICETARRLLQKS